MMTVSYYNRLLTTFFSIILVGVPCGDAFAQASLPSYAASFAAAQTAAANQDYTTAFDNYILASIADPTQPGAEVSALNVLEQNTPTTVNLSTLNQLTNSSKPFDVTISNTEVGTIHTNYKTVLIVPHDALATEQEDPVDNWPFVRAAYVYSSQDGVKANLICSVYYQSDGYGDLAAHMGALLAVLDDVYTQKMLVSRADDGYPFNVWLCSTAPVSNGGEQWRNNIYFYDVGDDRSSIEWIREIAHEFSHLAFQAIGGSYTFPEAFANGYLGERLLIRWISRGAAGGGPTVEAAWKRTFAGYPNFDRLLIKPSLKQYTTYGLNRTELARRDGDGMRYMIGMMLYVDDVCGSTTVGTTLQSVADQHSTDPNLLYEPVQEALEAYRQYTAILKKKVAAKHIYN